MMYKSFAIDIYIDGFILTQYIHVSIFICSKLTMHNVIIGNSHGGYLRFMQMRPFIIYVTVWYGQFNTDCFDNLVIFLTLFVLML